MQILRLPHPAARARSERAGLLLSALKDLDHQVETDDLFGTVWNFANFRALALSAKEQDSEKKNSSWS